MLYVPHPRLQRYILKIRRESLDGKAHRFLCEHRLTVCMWSMS